MEPKKSKKANVNRFNSTAIQLGLIVAILLSISAFRAKFDYIIDTPTILEPVYPEDMIAISTKEANEEEELEKPQPKEQTKEPVLNPNYVEGNTDELDSSDTKKIFSEPLTKDSSLSNLNDKMLGIDDGNDSLPYEAIEHMPSFPGGKEELFKFLKSNLSYPEIDREFGIHGTVVCQFIVNRKGEVTKIKIIRGVSENLDNEAIRVLKLMPKWNPGFVDGIPVNVRYTLPIRFKLKNKGF